MSRPCSLVLVVAVAACGGGGDGLSNGEAYTATYQVTLHQRNQPQGGAETIPCTDFGDDVVGEEMYFRLVKDDFLDDPNFLVMNPCMTDPATCDDFGFIHFEAHGDHLQEDGWSTQSNPGCALSAIRNYGVMLDASTIRIESQEWYGTADSNDCPLELAEALLGTPDCERNEAWEATRL